MKINIFLVLCVGALLVAQISTQRTLQQQHMNKPKPHPPRKIDQTNTQIVSDDPFMKKTPPEKAKRQPKADEVLPFPTKQESDQIWETYKPFDNEEKKEIRDDNDETDNEQFNELLKWGMVGGSVFLVFVLVKTCVKKNGRRQMRRIRQQALQRARINQVPQTGYYFVQPQTQQPIIMNNLNQQRCQQIQPNLDEKIIQAERELNKLKQMKQQTMKQEFNRKKAEDQQKRIDMINAQRKQVFEQSRRNNWNVGYGPVFYGQQNQVYVQGHQIQPQQPFQVKGIQPIRRRSNSFKTEVEQPIISNDIKYRNGIPIGKPVRQDNDSSFASEYPEV